MSGLLLNACAAQSFVLFCTKSEVNAFYHISILTAAFVRICRGCLKSIPCALSQKSSITTSYSAGLTYCFIFVWVFGATTNNPFIRTGFNIKPYKCACCVLICVNNRCHLSLPLIVRPIVATLCAWLHNAHQHTHKLQASHYPFLCRSRFISLPLPLSPHLPLLSFSISSTQISSFPFTKFPENGTRMGFKYSPPSHNTPHDSAAWSRKSEDNE